MYKSSVKKSISQLEISPLKLLFFISVIIVSTSRAFGVDINMYIEVAITLIWTAYFIINIGLKVDNTGFYSTTVRHIIYMLLPYIAMALYTLVIWVISDEIITLSNATRLVSTVLYLSLDIFFVAAGALIFKKNIVNVMFWGGVISYFIGSVLGALLFCGIDDILLYLYSIVGFDVTSSVGYYMEVHDLTFAFGVYFLYYLCYGKSEQYRKSKILISIIFILLGFKRIEVLAIIISLICFVTIFKLIKSCKILSIIVFLTAIICTLVFIAIVKNGFLVELIEYFGVDTAGRISYYTYASNYYDFSISYFGVGYSWFTRLWQQLYLSGFRLAGHGVAASIHSNILEIYIEIGMIGLIIWLFYNLFYRTKKLDRYYGGYVAKAYMVLSIYMVILYLTDNTLHYGTTQIAYFIIPLVLSLKYKEDMVSKHGK